MNTMLKNLILTGVLVGTSAAASAATITISTDPNAETNFLSLLHGGYAQENFDGWVTQGSGPAAPGPEVTNNFQREKLSWIDSSPSFVTNVGTFTLTENGHSSYPWLDGETHGNNLKIESAETGESGREVLSNYEGDFWLDSNDAKEVRWDFDAGAVVGKSFNAFGFYLADPADVAASLTLKYADGTYSDSLTIPFGQQNAELFYVSVVSPKSIVGASFYFNNSANNDGWGIDDITVGTLPEPGTLLLIALGLLGLGAARRKALK